MLTAEGWWTSTSEWLWFSRIRKAETDEGFVYLSKGGVQSTAIIVLQRFTTNVSEGLCRKGYGKPFMLTDVQT